MNNGQIGVPDQYISEPLSSSPSEILPIFCPKDFLVEQPGFPALDEGSTTSPLDHFESGSDQCCISFSEFEHQDDIMPSIVHGSDIAEHRCLTSAGSWPQEVYLNFQSTDTLQSLVQSSAGRDQLLHKKKFISEPNNLPLPQGNQVEYKQITESEADNARNQNNSFTTISFEKNHKIESRGEMQYHGFTTLVFGNVNTSERLAMTKKKRIRWTAELHNQFIECVNRLGGAKKATPKAILNLMKCEGLTIFHIKSHLQKYRVEPYIPSSKEDLEEIPDTCTTPLLDPKVSMQIVEALRTQIDVQRRLHEQLEVWSILHSHR